MTVGDVIRTRLAVQVKRWKQNVQSPVIQQARGSLGAHEQGLVITTSDFSKGAQEEAERADATPVGLMNGEQLVALLVENEIGVRPGFRGKSVRPSRGEIVAGAARGLPVAVADRRGNPQKSWMVGDTGLEPVTSAM